MSDMKQIEKIQKEFAGVSGPISLWMDGTKFFYVDVDADILQGYKHVTASCGCCSEIEDIESDLSYELEYMDDLDFADLIEELKKLIL